MSTYYFYTDIESRFNCRRVQAMLEGNLPLTNPSRFNDPFDSQLRFAHGFTKEEAIKFLGWDKPATSVGRLFRANKDPVEAAEAIRERRTWENWNTFCVSEVFDSMLMWAHYGMGHKGICLELEYDESARPEFSFFEKVRYSTHYPEINGARIGETDEGALKTLLLTKSIDWHYEREWRLTCRNASSCKLFDARVDSPFRVTGIIFGSKFDRGGQFTFINKEFSERLQVALGNSPELFVDEYNKIAEEHLDHRKKVLRGIATGRLEPVMNDMRLRHALRKNWKTMRLFRRERLLYKIKDANIHTAKCRVRKGEYGLSFSEYDLELCGDSLMDMAFGMSYIRMANSKESF